MTQLWSIIIPEAGTNLITNPSFETGVTNWTAGGTNTFAQSSAQSFRGAYSGLLTYGNTATGMVAYTPSPSASTSYVLSCWIYVPANWDGGNIYLDAINYGGATETVNHQYTHGTSPTAEWVYLETVILFDVDVAGTIGLTASSAPTAGRTLYMDAVQLEQNTYATTYIDGDQGDGYEWTGTVHGSTSTRSAQERSGGRVRSLDDYSVVVRYQDGVGAPPAQHKAQYNALMYGATFQGRRVMPRTFTLTSVLPGTSASNLHELRKDLWDAIKPDLVVDDQPFILRYSGAHSTREVEIPVVYDAGFEFGATSKIDKFAIRLIAYDPFFREIRTKSTHLTTSESVADADYAIKRIDGDWSNINTAFNGTVEAIVKAPDGSIYLGGLFTNVGDANGDYIVKYDPVTGTLTSLGTGLNNFCYALAVAPNGDIYAGGAFTLAGGVANTVRIAYWDVSAGVWVPLSTGIGSGAVHALGFDQSGNLYVGGTFTNHVDANGDYITMWSGAAFSSLSTGMNGAVYSLAVDPSNYLYAGGMFTTAGGTTVNYVAKWNSTAWSALSTGMSDIVEVLAVDESGYLYAGGSFTTAGGTTVNYVAKWNGAAWSALGSGMNSIVYGLATDKNGLLYASGSFTTAGGVALADRMAVWNGSTWAHIPANLPGAPGIYSTLTDGDDLYLGYSTSGSATTSALTTVNNPGTATTYPKIVFGRTGGTSAVVEYLKNETTGATLWLNYSLLDGETLTIDLTPGDRSCVSSFFGDVWRAVLRNSNFAKFNLLPGDNSISTFVNNTGATITCYMEYPVVHWSADGAAA